MISIHASQVRPRKSITVLLGRYIRLTSGRPVADETSRARFLGTGFLGVSQLVSKRVYADFSELVSTPTRHRPFSR